MESSEIGGRVGAKNTRYDGFESKRGEARGEGEVTSAGAAGVEDSSRPLSLVELSHFANRDIIANRSVPR